MDTAVIFMQECESRVKEQSDTRIFTDTGLNYRVTAYSSTFAGEDVLADDTPVRTDKFPSWYDYISTLEDGAIKNAIDGFYKLGHGRFRSGPAFGKNYFELPATDEDLRKKYGVVTIAKIG
jgi:hypothetical protein